MAKTFDIKVGFEPYYKTELGGTSQITIANGIPIDSPSSGEPTIYQNIDNGALYVWNGTSWDLVAGSAGGTWEEEKFTAVGEETSLTLSYSPLVAEAVFVFIGGIKNDDVTLSSATVTFVGFTLATGDKVTINYLR